MGDSIIAGSEFGRVRAMFDESGKPRAGGRRPPCRWWCWACPARPTAGDELLAVESERKAREVALYRQGKFRDVKLARQSTRAEDVFSQMGEAKAGVVVGADQGGRAGQRRGAARGAHQALHRGGAGQGHRQRPGRHHRVGRAAGRRLQGAHHRLQRARRFRRPRGGQGDRRRRALLQHHLRSHRRREADDDRHAAAGDQGADRGHRAGARGVPLQQVRRRGRVPGDRGRRSSATTRSACCATTW